MTASITNVATGDGVGGGGGRGAVISMPVGRNKEHTAVVPPKSLVISDIRKAIPDKYFERSLPTGLFYLGRDLAQVAATVAGRYFFCLPLMSKADDVFGESTVAALAIRFILWNVYWFIQGCNDLALWVLAHECGHQAFSACRPINDTVGCVLHSTFLVPYHSWRISHGAHHKNTNHLGMDTAHVPPERESVLKEAAEESPIIIFAQIVFAHIFGWFAYLGFNLTGRKYNRRASHFEPSSPIFKPSDKMDVIVSDIGIALNLLTVVVCSYLYSVSDVVCWYFIPYMWTSGWAVYITFLQHYDARIVQYNLDVCPRRPRCLDDVGVVDVVKPRIKDAAIIAVSPHQRLPRHPPLVLECHCGDSAVQQEDVRRHVDHKRRAPRQLLLEHVDAVQVRCSVRGYLSVPQLIEFIFPSIFKLRGANSCWVADRVSGARNPFKIPIRSNTYFYSSHTSHLIN